MSDEKSLSKSEAVYSVLLVLFCVCITIAHMSGIKLFQAPFASNYALPSGLLVYPLTFLLTDLVSEIWGEKRANFMVFVGFVMSLMVLFFMQLILYLPPHASWYTPNNPFNFSSLDEYQSAFSSVFSVAPKAMLASLLAYGVAQLMDVRIFHFFKKLTNDKHLWLRNNVSTLISQFFDTIIVWGIIAYWGLNLSLPVTMNLIMICYAYKLVIALCDTPFVYLGVAVIRHFINKEQKQNKIKILPVSS